MTSLQGPEKIIEGVGVGSIQLDRSTLEDVIATYGDRFQREELFAQNTWNEELPANVLVGVTMASQELGATFSCNALTKLIDSIRLYPPFNGVTTRGVILGVTTMREAIAIYGPPHWSAAKGDPTWCVSYTGISLYVKRDLSVPQFPLDESRHLGKPISQIIVSK